MVTQLTYIFLMAAARLSILMLYRRIFSLKIRWFRLAWWMTVCIVVAYGLVLLAVFLTQCSPHPMDTLWLNPAKCRSGTRYIESEGPTIGGFINAAIDVCLILLLIKMVYGLRMTNKRKVLVCGLFDLGLL